MAAEACIYAPYSQSTSRPRMAPGLSFPDSAGSPTLVYSSFAIGTTLFLMAVFMAVTFYFKKKEEANSKTTLETCNKTSEEIA